MYTWKWYFGDGDSALTQNATHTYIQAGRFDVRLSITDPSGTYTTTNASYVIAYADSLKLQQFSGTKTDPLIYEVRLRNYAPITSMTLPFVYSGNMDIALDSISYVGTRGLAFESRQMPFGWPVGYRFSIRLIANNGGGSPPLAAGEGVLFKLYFKYDANPPVPGHNVIDTSSYLTYLFDVGTSFGSYTPTVVTGAIDIHGPRGDADQSNNIDVGDVVFVVNYIFAGGPAPSLYSGDADASGAIDISDPVYLVAYIFAGGPPPPPL